MKNKANRFIGAFVILIGILLLLNNFNILGPIFGSVGFGTIMSKFWPSIFLVIPGLLFHYGFLTGGRKDAGLLVPGGILLILGIVFQFNMLFGGWDMSWPIYIFAVAFGLFELYVFGGREKGLLIPIGILSGLSVIFFLTFSLKELLGPGTRAYITPIVLIFIGLIVLFGKRPVE